MTTQKTKLALLLAAILLPLMFMACESKTPYDEEVDRRYQAAIDNYHNSTAKSKRIDSLRGVLDKYSDSIAIMNKSFYTEANYAKKMKIQYYINYYYSKKNYYNGYITCLIDSL